VNETDPAAIMDEFLSVVSHELRTPLNSVLGWARLLRTGGLDEPTRVRALETIERNAIEQARLLEDLSDISRILAGRVTLERQEVALADVVGDAIATVDGLALEKNVRIEPELDGSLRVVADRDRLHQVVWNLLTNAIKFSAMGGKVRVTVDGEGGDARLRVSDQGQGIAPELLPRIFERRRTNRRGKGELGLGLAIVKRLVALHEGTVRAESAGEGQGATFEVRLKLHGA
jgi:signal transduction histidine kinase